MRIIHHKAALRTAVAGMRAHGRIALVPTMGALHQGHLTLVREARALGAQVVVSIFVNPRQFGAGEDLDAYPRQLEADAALLADEGVAILWAPTPEEVYPEGYATNISVAGVSEGLCGGSRPGHFDGVSTVVNKLFNQVQPDVALFGEKDWQQLAVIRRMARDLDLTHPSVDNIIGVPTVREKDGLALSSRNAYLSAEERAQAVSLPTAMRKAIAAIEKKADVAETLAALEAEVLEGGFTSVDYAELRDAENLTPLAELGQRPARLLVAARIGKARLIDNMAVSAK
ncbi:pantoate--beta-alanine ligase [Novosphingobium terrae]|uniref:pantoate--beta-alanine ligase n=1 Tax=Novosphingobium terrae TaxID=2726189 RepID=UPI00197E7316|nr:pantoate--beta-alanine ligase [Novosphingobium terrae]